MARGPDYGCIPCFVTHIGRRFSERMDENAFQAVLLRHFQQSVKMFLPRVNTAIGNKPEQMQTPLSAARKCRCSTSS